MRIIVVPKRSRILKRQRKVREENNDIVSEEEKELLHDEWQALTQTWELTDRNNMLLESTRSAFLFGAVAAVRCLRNQLAGHPGDTEVLDRIARSMKEKIDTLLQRESLISSNRTTH